MSTINVIPFSKNHRTAIVFDARANLNSERAKRLIESVNGPNIKVDFFTLSGDGTLAMGTKVSAAAPAPAAGTTLAPGTPFDLAGSAVVTEAAAVEHVHDQVRNALGSYDLVAIVA